MLVLSRGHGERIFIGDNIMVVALGIRGGQMRIGIEAPPEVNIVREELREAKKQERRMID